MKYRLIGCLIAAATINGAWAQGGTRSPYSQFGIGALTDQSQSMSRGMNGVGYALREGNMVNTLNPASYSSVDSLTMLFDMGLSGQTTNFKEGNVSRNASIANFEYVAGSFRAWRNVGIAFGMLPYSNVGYDYAATTRNASTGTLTQTYTGTGGLHQLFLGVGWRIFKPLSVGVNASYLWGNIERSVTPTSSSASNTLTKKYVTSVNSYKLDFGLQWQQRIGKADHLTVGAVVGLGHNLKNDADMMVSSVNSGSNSTYADTTRIADAMALPTSFGFGAAYNKGGKLTVAADFTLDKWGELDFPGNAAGSGYQKMSGLLQDRTKVNVGADWLPNPEGRKYIEHVHYRIGAGYATPYYKINGQDGPKEFSVSAGFGIPIINMHNNRSLLNISAQWVHASATNFITENTFRINIGVTFNERWFMKWKVD